MFVDKTLVHYGPTSVRELALSWYFDKNLNYYYLIKEKTFLQINYNVPKSITYTNLHYNTFT